MKQQLEIQRSLRDELLATASSLFEISAELSGKSSDPLLTSAHAYFTAYWLASGEPPPRSCSTSLLKNAIGRTIALLPETELKPALADGYLGIAWLTNAASAVGLGGRDVVPDDVLDAALAEDLPALRTSEYYDFLNGVTGTLWFELHRRAGPRPAAVAARIETLSAMSQSTEDGICWWTPLRIARWGMSSGYHDLGFAHGHAGVVAALAKAQLCLPSAQTLGLLEGTVAAYDAMLAEHPGHFIPHATVPGLSPTRHAWCYGTPGVALGMFAAARALNRQERADDWGRRLGLALCDDPGPAHVDSPGVCHGAAGLALIAMRAGEHLGEGAGALACRWLEHTVRLCAGSTFSSSDNPMLDGPAGAGLVLLSAIARNRLDCFDLLGIPDLAEPQLPRTRTEQVQCGSRS